MAYINNRKRILFNTVNINKLFVMSIYMLLIKSYPAKIPGTCEQHVGCNDYILANLIRLMIQQL